MITRREGLKSAFLLGMTGALGLAADRANAQQIPGNGTVLVVYFSRSGNTRVIAGQIRRALGADLFEIQPAEAYPEDYEAVVSQAQSERQTGHEPPLKAMVPSIEAYETIFLGFPIWGMSAPPPIRSFLSGHDLSGKTIVPFITHGGYGLGQSLAVVAEHAPRARVIEGFSLQADQERDTLSRVTEWLGGVEIGE